MSRFLDLKEFGDAARYLRLTNLEHLAAKAQAFDGTLILPLLSDASGMFYINMRIYELFLKQGHTEFVSIFFFRDIFFKTSVT